jgi:hypothetical protein
MTHDPVGFCEYAYAESPRPWQREILALIGSHLQDEASRHSPLRVAVSSGHGIGKSALVSMIIDWGMSTCEDCKVILTANTGTQLATKTVPEVHKWFGRSINAHWWEMKATSITVRDPEHSKLWRMDAIPWSTNNTEAFAGAHNKGKRIILIFDEASAIEDSVWEVAEGALTDEETEIIFLAFGNPTKNTGRFRECFGSFKHRWKTFQIDSRTVEGTNKAEIAKWIEDYGEDSDFVRVRVRGEFPRAGSSQFIASDIVAAARKGHAEGFHTMPKVLSVDVARFGDDQTVIGTRQGRKALILGKYRGLDTVQVAERTIEWMGKEAPDATVIDGDGLGAGVVDQIRFRGFGQRLFEFHGGVAANDAAAYFNRSAECWGAMRDWLAAGAEIPDDPELGSQLESRQYGFSNKGQIQLEKKIDMKSRGLESPDIADCLSMTFSVKVAAPKPVDMDRPQYGDYQETSWMA